MRFRVRGGGLVLMAAIAISVLGSAGSAAAKDDPCSDGRLRYVTSDFDAQRALIAAGVLDSEVGEGDCKLLGNALQLYDKIYGAPEGATFREKVDKIKPRYAEFAAAFDLKEVEDTGWPLLVPGSIASAPTKNSEANEWYYKFKTSDDLFITTYKFGVRPNPPSKHLAKSLQADSGQKIAEFLQSGREFRLRNTSRGDRVIHRFREAFVSGRSVFGLYVAYPDAPFADFVPPPQLAPLIAAWKNQIALGDAGPRPVGGFNAFGLDAAQVAELTAAAKGDPALRSPEAVEATLRRWAWLRSMGAVALLSGSHFEEKNRWKTIVVSNCLERAEDRKVRVVFATNREATGKLGSSVLAETWFRGAAHAQNALTVGCAVISTPPYGEQAVKAEAVEARSYEQDKSAQQSSTAFTTVKATQLDGPTVEETSYRLRILDSERRLFKSEDRALVYVHGYNTPFETALFQAAQIAAATDYPGRVYLFSWPSAGSAVRYLADMDSAERSEPHFTDFLRGILSDPALKEIDLVGHSMGSQILTRSLNAVLDEFYSRDGIRLGQVILSAPDISTEVFTAKVLEISRLAKGVTIYGSAADWPLWGSGFIRDANRLGLIVGGKVPEVPGARYITATPIDNACTLWGYGRLGHSYITDEPEMLRHISRVLKRSRYNVAIDTAKGDQVRQDVVTPETPKCWWRPEPLAERRETAAKEAASKETEARDAAAKDAAAKEATTEGVGGDAAAPAKQ